MLPKKNNIPSLDSLRGLLSLTVVLAHGWQVFVNPVEPDGTVAGYVAGLFARIAVLFFFCLSGYVIAQSIHANRTRHGRFDFSDYFWARFFRIVPPLVLVIALTYCIEILLILLMANTVESERAARRVFSTDVLSQLIALASIGLQGNLPGNWLNGPLWTLRYEIQLYALSGLAAVALFSPSRWIAGAAKFVLAVVAFALIQLVAGVFHHGLLRHQVSGQNPMLISFCSFAFGVAAYVVRSRRSTLLSALFASAFGVAGICFLSPIANSLNVMDTDPLWLGAQVLGSIGLGAAVALIAQSGFFNQLAPLGKFSYTLYIAHFPTLLLIYFLVNKFTPSLLIHGWLLMSFSISVTFLTLMRLGQYIEQPGSQRRAAREWLHRYRKK